MDLRNYIADKKQLQRSLLTFLDQEDTEGEENYQNLTNLIHNQKFGQNKDELTAFLHLISQISANHHRTNNFHTKIDRVISILDNEIKENFINLELFHIFKRNKRILLYLIQNNLIFMDENIAKVLSKLKYRKLRYIHYFYPELKGFLTDPKLKKKIEEDIIKYDDETFKRLREQGENDQEVCELIRNDSLNDFLSHSNDDISNSIFETNMYLIKNKTSLIDYSAFFGSVEIFKYLLSNNDQITPELWFYAIHGQNLEIIKLLQEKNVRCRDHSFVTVLEESFKCHNGEVTKYVKDNLTTIRANQETDVLSRSTKYYDYENFPNNLNNQFAFCYLCQADYISLLKKIVNLSKRNFELNMSISSIPNFFLY